MKVFFVIIGFILASFLVFAINFKTISEKVDFKAISKKVSTFTKSSSGSRMERHGDDVVFIGSKHEEGTLEYYIEYTNKFGEFVKTQPDFYGNDQRQVTIKYVNNKKIIYNAEISAAPRFNSKEVAKDKGGDLKRWSIKQACMTDVFLDFINAGGSVTINMSADEHRDFYQKSVSKSDCSKFLSENKRY